MSGRNLLRAVPRAVPRRALNFNLSEDSLALQEVARKFAREEMLPKAAHHDQTMEYPQEIFKQAWELGLGESFVWSFLIKTLIKDPLQGLVYFQRRHHIK